MKVDALLPTGTPFSCGYIILLTGLLVTVACVTASAFARRPASVWNYYHFDGRAFVAGQPPDSGTLLALREGMSPIVVTTPTKIEEVPLPSGKGAIAGLCYIQSSGGKLSNAGAHTPVPRATVQILSAGKVIAQIETDEHGYFVAALAAGRYSVVSGPAMLDVTVENGKTILVPLRAGKRMVD